MAAAPHATIACAVPPPVGDYRDVLPQAIDAKNRKRWDEAARLFQMSLSLWEPTPASNQFSGTFFEPYVPHYYLGVALMNLNNCQQALANWDLSEKDGAVLKTPNLYASLQQNRKHCQQRP